MRLLKLLFYCSLNKTRAVKAFLIIFMTLYRVLILFPVLRFQTTVGSTIIYRVDTSLGFDYRSTFASSYNREFYRINFPTQHKYLFPH